VALISPVSGRILRVLQESETVVQAGTPVLEVGDPSALEIVVDVLSADAVRIEPGAPVRIEDWGGNAPLQGRVVRIEPAAFTERSALGVEEQRVNVIVEPAGDDPRWARLGDGYRVQTHVVVWQARDALSVPTAAVFKEGGRWVVYLVRDGRAQIQPVGLGERGGAQVQITTGLSPGDRVIAFPSDRLRDGARVVASERRAR
jgi:HlyD family secretion protein